MQPPQDPIFHIEVDKIKPNPYQPRRDFNEEALKELASSIREFGILHPIVVTKTEVPSEQGTQVEYQLIAGERRWLASRMVGMERIPATIKIAPSDRDRLELAIIENIQRENLNAIETARAYAKLQDQFSLTQREVAARLGKSREVVANTLRLLNLPPYIQDAVSKSQINESQGRLLLMVTDLNDQQALFDDLVRNNLSVRELKNRIYSNRRVVDLKPSRPEHADPDTLNLEEQLREVLGTQVKVQKEGEGGKLTINFYSQEELAGLIQRLMVVKAQETISSMEQSPAQENPQEPPSSPADFVV